ncbi:MAG: type II secretion system protein [Verrucomicrobiales bacterium]|nr:type II secretion system protein [Verrucomicrobiales bacterium]
MNLQSQSNSKRAIRGMSLSELMITISILGILAAVAVNAYGDIFGKSKDTISQNVVATLNKATREFSYSQWDLEYTATPTSAKDEMYVLRTLQWKDPDNSELNPKGPFMRQDWNPTTSSDTKDHRIEWTGSAWKLTKPGTAGTGLKVAFDGTDLGTPHVHATGFTPAGAK